MKKSRDTANIHWSATLHHTNRAMAYDFKCPKCHAEIEEPCVYLTDRGYYSRFKIGKPTQRPHVERTYLVQKMVYQMRQEQLKAWLIAFGDVLVNFVCEPCSNADHANCPGKGHCDCQHRPKQ